MAPRCCFKFALFQEASKTSLDLDFYWFGNLLGGILEDFVFFENLLKTEPNDNSISFKKSNIFFKNKDDEILFINKIFDSKFYYDSKNLQNVLDSKNEVFNVPFKITIRNDKFNKEFLTKFDSNKIRLNIENIIDYENKSKKGIMDILFINKTTTLEYELDQNSLNLMRIIKNSVDPKNILNPGKLFT